MSVPTHSPSLQDVPRLVPARNAELEMLQPFGHDVCAHWRDALHGSEVPMHEDALQALRVLESEGRVTLLHAPRAGHGKTHLLGRVARRLQEDAVVAGLPWISLEGLSWSATGRGMLQDLASAGRHPTLLQRVSAGVLATLLRRMIQTGRIPCTDPVQAMRVLSQDPTDLFAEGKSASVIGSWFRRHFEQLAKPLAECAGHYDADALEGWLRGLFHYLENPCATAVAALEAPLEKDGAVEVTRFVRLITAWKPLVLVADHMDGVYRNQEAGVAIARMALAFVSMPGVHVMLSMNQDLWETTFGGHLPSALEDRLSSYSVPLRGPTPQEAQSLIRMRLQDAGVEEEHAHGFLNFLDLDRFFLSQAVGSVSVRGLLRHAAQVWRHWLAAGAPSASPHQDMPVAATATTTPFPATRGGNTPAPPSPAAPPPKAEDDGTFPSFPLGENDKPGTEDDEALKKLAEHLAQDSGGRVVDLSSAPGSLPPAGPTPPQVINIVPVGAARQ
ncbi:hypothetical protein [Roseimicrobium sp. ORNL1]|uniref:hypothetical protein n=1 Tax=Roseimicrobium sp. ORNL1 TaxID=2711231 RepID=UPI0013E12DD1|nr:hypothetical protein [Roseimicrobium sp. ORNL1]QIF03738.1 hypothetical protein G5S37_20170 [Roseimicrobium sp. ORNL1]